MEGIKWWIELANESWPIAILIFLAVVGRSMFNWIKPKMDLAAERMLGFLETGIDANSRNADSFEKISQELSPISQSVRHIEEVQGDPNSILSNVQPIRKLDMSLAHDRAIAHALVQVMESLLQRHEDDREFCERIERAIDILRDVERSI